MSKKKLDEEYEIGKAMGKAEAAEEAHQGREVSIVPRELEQYANSLPYSRDRILEELRFLFQHEVAAKYEIGKRLFLLKEMEGIRRGGDQSALKRTSFNDIIGEHFPGLSPRRAYEYILFAQKATKKFKEWAEGGKNWKKALALMETFEEKEIKALEDGEPVQGVLFDELDTLTVAELKERLKKQSAQIEKGKEQVAKQAKEIERFQKGYRPTEEQFHVQMEGFRLSFDQLMNRVDPEIMEIMEVLKKESRPTVRMIAHYLEILDYMKKRILGAYGVAEDTFGTADMFPENVWRPGEGLEAVDAMRKRSKKE